MSYGSPAWSPWIKEEEESIKQIKLAYQAGINFFDTADAYSSGLSEMILGKALKEIGAPRGKILSTIELNRNENPLSQHQVEL